MRQAMLNRDASGFIGMGSMGDLTDRRQIAYKAAGIPLILSVRLSSRRSLLPPGEGTSGCHFAIPSPWGKG